MKPDEIPNFVKMINQHNYDFVNGSRFTDRKYKQSNYESFNKNFNKIISFIYNRRITDATYGLELLNVQWREPYKTCW